MKIIFLDIDGVLNSKRTGIVYGENKKIDDLDPISVGLVYQVVQETGCVVCLSSDWRFSHDYIELGKQLHLPIMFETPNLSRNLENSENDKFCRGDEIKEVVEGIKPEKYVILDDLAPENDPYMRIWGYQDTHLVKVATEDGVSYQNYLDLVRILK